jgi:hypothetical protein
LGGADPSAVGFHHAPEFFSGDHVRSRLFTVSCLFV